MRASAFIYNKRKLIMKKCQFDPEVWEYAKQLLIAAAKEHQPPYFAEPFDPHEYTIEVVAEALIVRLTGKQVLELAKFAGLDVSGDPCDIGILRFNGMDLVFSQDDHGFPIGD